MAQAEKTLVEGSSLGAHSSVEAALKRTLEGELISLANVPNRTAFNHSKEGGGGQHSKDGHDHSKNPGGDEIFSADDETAHAQFAERLLSLQSEMSVE